MSDIILKNHNGENVTYKDVQKIRLNTADGNTQLYTLMGSNFDFADTLLNYFAYKINEEEKEIIIYYIDYPRLYEDTGGCDVNIPATIGGYNVVLACT